MDDPTLGYVHNQNTEFWNGWVPKVSLTQWGLAHRGVVLCIFQDRDEARYQERLLRHQLFLDDDYPALSLEEYLHGYYARAMQ